MKKKKIKNSEQELQKSKNVLYLLLLLILVFAVLLLVEKTLLGNKEEGRGANLLQVNIITNEMSQEEVNQIQTEIKELAKESEINRMKYYCNQYISCIEKEEYEKAYEYLYPEFKKTYFPSLEEYQKYVKERYSSYVQTDYQDMQRQGNIYIFFLKIQDPLHPNDKKKNFSQKFIIQEKAINDFVISFEVAK